MTSIWRKFLAHWDKCRQKGQILVFTAVLLPLLIAACGFTVDFGNMYMHKSKLQTQQMQQQFLEHMLIATMVIHRKNIKMLMILLKFPSMIISPMPQSLNASIRPELQMMVIPTTEFF